MYSNPTYNVLSENDIRSFLQEAPQSRFNVSSTFIPSVLIAVGVCAILFLSFNAQSFFMINSISPQDVEAAPVAVPTTLPTTAPAIKVVATPKPTPIPPTIPNNSLNISALGISAPITWYAPMEAKTQSKLLNNGLVHIDGTPRVGEKGMSAISGHSSNYPWIKSSYNSIFAPLVKAEIGQIIEINRDNTQYTYRITKKYEVKPNQVSVLEDHSTNGLRLITCTPVGTTLRRLIVEAEQITPDPIDNADYTPVRFSAPALSGR